MSKDKDPRYVSVRSVGGEEQTFVPIEELIDGDRLQTQDPDSPRFNQAIGLAQGEIRSMHGAQFPSVGEIFHRPTATRELLVVDQTGQVNARRVGKRVQGWIRCGSLDIESLESSPTTSIHQLQTKGVPDDSDDPHAVTIAQQAKGVAKHRTSAGRWPVHFHPSPHNNIPRKRR